MEVIDQLNYSPLNWFRYVSDNPDEQPPLSFRVALEEFYQDGIGESTYLGYTKHDDGSNPNYLIGTNELRVINDLKRTFGNSIEIINSEEILCII
jgi:hypothetical protein